jgi:hypothetical protein
MDIAHAAERLYEELHAPRGALNVIPWPDQSGNFYIRVWLYRECGDLRVPSSFDGYPVRVERRSPNVATQ